MNDPGKEFYEGRLSHERGPTGDWGTNTQKIVDKKYQLPPDVQEEIAFSLGQISIGGTDRTPLEGWKRGRGGRIARKVFTSDKRGHLAFDNSGQPEAFWK